MIRKIDFRVNANGVEPAARQKAGMQGEHNATELKFLLDGTLYAALLEKKREGDSLRYRFDAFDGSGCPVCSGSEELTDSALVYNVPAALSAAGGNAEVFIVITLIRADNTELELLSYPARLYFVPSGEDNEEKIHESMTTLEQNAKNAADAAAAASAAAVEAKEAAAAALEQTEQARAAIEAGSEFLFDGGDAYSDLPIEYMIDDELSASSENPVKNKAVAKRLNETEQALDGKINSSELGGIIADAISAAKADMISQAKEQALSAAHPVGSLYLTLSQTDNPANIFGGSWERIARGRTLVGAMESTDADYDSDFSVGKTGGEKKHTLTTDEIPEHAHEQRVAVATDEEVVLNTRRDYNNDGKAKIYPQIGTPTAAAGGGQPHNNMPPYLAVYIWKRIS